MNDSTVFPNLKVKVFGIGGAGNNAINNIIADDQFDSSAIEFWAINTDSQHLQDNRNKCENKLLLANPIYSGCGAGGDPKVGKECALNSIDQIKEILGWHKRFDPSKQALVVALALEQHLLLQM